MSFYRVRTFIKALADKDYEFSDLVRNHINSVPGHQVTRVPKNDQQILVRYEVRTPEIQKTFYFNVDGEEILETQGDLKVILAGVTGVSS